jgi:PAS domain S-box-containing protein
LVRILVLALIALLSAAEWARLGGRIPWSTFYLAPLLLAAPFLGRKEVAALAAVCVLLAESLSASPWGPGFPFRLLIGAAAFGGASLFAGELAARRKRRLALDRLIEEERLRRKEAEDELRVLTETTPAAILMIDGDGMIQLANQAAHEMLGAGERPLTGEPIQRFFPPLAHIPLPDDRQKILRTTLDCRGRRCNGEVFPAHVWLASYWSQGGPMLAAVIVDASEELRDRQAAGLDQLMRSSSILFRAVSHEIRNVCAAISVVYANLKRVPGLESNEDFQALGTLVEGLGRLASSELRQSLQKAAEEVSLREVLEELRIVIEPSFAGEGALLRWMVPEDLPPVVADRHGLLHVFMNLTRNSLRAMRGCADRRLVIGASVEGDRVTVRFSDSGCGVERPELLFQPFQQSPDGAGLGLYLSRALVRSYAGELAYEPQPYGACFAVSLAIARRETKAATP